MKSLPPGNSGHFPPGQDRDKPAQDKTMSLNLESTYLECCNNINLPAPNELEDTMDIFPSGAEHPRNRASNEEFHQYLQGR